MNNMATSIEEVAIYLNVINTVFPELAIYWYNDGIISSEIKHYISSMHTTLRLDKTSNKL